MTISYKNIHFDQYLALLKSLYPTINGLLVFDREANLVWQDADNRLDQEQLLSLVPKFLRSDSDSLVQNLLNGELGELVKLNDKRDMPTLFRDCGFDYTDESIEAGSSVRMYVATPGG